MPSGPAAENRALVIEAGHEDIHPSAHLTDDIFLRHLAVFENEFRGIRAPHAKLVELWRDGETLHALLDKEGGYAARACFRIRLRINEEYIRVRRIGDPHLRAV